MKEHNALVRFKNSFISDPEKQEKLGSILTEDLGDVIGKKMEAVQSLYRSQAAENGYEAGLAYRVIVIHLLSGSHKGFDIKEEVTRLFKYCLGRGQLEDLRLCFDLLLLKELAAAIGDELRLLKVRVLRGLRDYYSGTSQAKEKKRCARMLQEYSRDALSREEIKRYPESYSQILDALIEETKRRVSVLIRRGGKIVAVEELSAFVQVLERSEQIVSRKYQLELMETYWSLAVLHEQLHYQAYTKKYATIAFNIAERTEMHSQAGEIRQLLERLL